MTPKAFRLEPEALRLSQTPASRVALSQLRRGRDAPMRERTLARSQGFNNSRGVRRAWKAHAAAKGGGGGGGRRAGGRGSNMRGGAPGGGGPPAGPRGGGGGRERRDLRGAARTRPPPCGRPAHCRLRSPLLASLAAPRGRRCTSRCLNCLLVSSVPS